MKHKEKKLVNVQRVSKPRDLAIDYLRSISIIIMIILHINPYFPRMGFSSWFVNMGQWVVPAFILCSLAVGSTNDVVDVQTYGAFIWRRLKRLLIPYYLWLIAYLGLFIVLGHKHLEWKNVYPNLIFTGGIDFNWLVLLFVSITLVLPFLNALVAKSEKLSILVLILCGFLTTYFLWNRSYWWTNYRASMILPWYGVVVGLQLMMKWMRSCTAEDNIAVSSRPRIAVRGKLPMGSNVYCSLDPVVQRDDECPNPGTSRRPFSNGIWKVVLFIFINFIVFILSYQYLLLQRSSVNTFNHKYPPDIFFFSYCLWTTPIAYLMMKQIAHIVSDQSLISRFLQYVSINSYTIFFIHLIVLYILDAGFPRRPFNYATFAILVFGGTLLLTGLVGYVDHVFSQLFLKRVNT